MKSRCLSFEGRIKRDLACLHKTVIAKHAKLLIHDGADLFDPGLARRQELESQK